MKKYGCLIILLLFVVSTFAYAHENVHVHPVTLTGYAGELIKQKLKDPYKEIFEDESNGGYLKRGTFGDDNDIADGSYREDSIGSGGWDHWLEVPGLSMGRHFYNAWDGGGIDGFPSIIKYYQDANEWSDHRIPYSMNMLQYAIALYTNQITIPYPGFGTGPSAKEHAYFVLGRMTHLLQDMTSPSHVSGDNHFLPWVDNSGDNYEDWGKDNATDIESYLSNNLNQLNIKDISSWETAIDELAKETYRNIAIEGVLNRDPNHPADGDLGSMFNDDNQIVYLEYIPPDNNYVVWGEWHIAGVGTYYPQQSGSLMNWWPMQAITGMNQHYPNSQYFFY